MTFEFDDKKSAVNKEKHGIDFIEAQKMWDDPERVEIPARSVDESRFLVIAKINDNYWSAVHTMRNGNIRIISVRKSRDNEKEIYFSSKV